ncbi:ParB/RepB/Spo0J family partition protein [Alphaproteobacteria bacterium]|nr:ParB/RepB/Spo0J family partition protein [Alphaproteobacteria bacterium]
MKNKKLGMGLSSLLGAKETKKVDNKQLEINPNEKNLFFIPIEKIIRDPEQPRKIFNDENIKELALSIKKHGLIQPIIIRKHGENEYKIVAGERRWRAAQIAELNIMPSIILPSDLDKDEVSLIENIQREDLRTTEEAIAYNNLIEKNKYSHEQLASIVGKSRSHVTNTLRILNLDKFFLDLLDNEIITLGHAKILIGKKQNDLDPNIIEKMKSSKLSVRELERNLSKNFSKPPTDINIINEEKNLSSLIGFKSQIKYNSKGQGYIKIFYDNLEQYDFIVKKIKN